MMKAEKITQQNGVDMKVYGRRDPRVFILERDSQYRRGFPDTVPLPADFLPENQCFKPAEVKVDWTLYTEDEGMISSSTALPVVNNQMVLKKWLSEQVFHYEHDEDYRKIRGKKFDEVIMVRLRLDEVMCKWVAQKRARRKQN